VKQCLDCGLTKPLVEFSRRLDGRADGYRSRCHACDARYSAARYLASHPDAMPRGTGPLSTTYRAAHQRVQRLRGRAAEWPCSSGCGNQAHHWAYDHKDPDEITGWSVGRRAALVTYSVDPDHYVALCRSCHGRLDADAAARRAADRLRTTADDLATWVRPPAGFALLPQG
jgi:hypothetical protein